MKYIACLFLAFLSVNTYSWELDEKVDAMTDKKTLSAYVESSDGHRFSLIKKDDNTIWGYLSLSGVNQFMVNEHLLVRIDKNKPKEISDKFEKLSYELGMGENYWEWNPNLIAFRLIPIGDNDSCGAGIKEYYNGDKLVIRYHPNKSTYKDIFFDISSKKDNLVKALNLDFSKC